MLALALALSQQPDVSPVYRCAFEERSRMVLIKMSPTRWMAFNPKTCAIQKIWEGDVDWRGKVYDFSQDTSRARGKVLFELPSTLETLTALYAPRIAGGTGPSCWEAEGAKIENGVTTFQSDSGYVVSAVIMTGGFRNIYVAFDESSRTAPFRVEVLDWEDKVSEWFYSTTHGGSDTDFQWNYKQIWPKDHLPRIKFTSAKATVKKLRNVRIIGDYEMFSGDKPVEITWKGYEVGLNVVHLKFELRTGEQVISASITPGEEIRMRFAGNLTGVKLRIPFEMKRLAVVGTPTDSEYPLTPEMRLRLKEGLP